MSQLRTVTAEAFESRLSGHRRCLVKTINWIVLTLRGMFTCIRVDAGQRCWAAIYGLYVRSTWCWLGRYLDRKGRDNLNLRSIRFPLIRIANSESKEYWSSSHQGSSNFSIYSVVPPQPRQKTEAESKRGITCNSHRECLKLTYKASAGLFMN
ncbi:Uncharacterized protein HZ326_26373 [Fusarium oxysporum f. sp. albedinis]|nr:Uncharacterized protein HZ326_26373 [Fusarium oxysporum f. sp. albedinis]